MSTHRMITITALAALFAGGVTLPGSGADHYRIAYTGHHTVQSATTLTESCAVTAGERRAAFVSGTLPGSAPRPANAYLCTALILP